MKNNAKHKITGEVIRLINQAITDNRGSKAAFCRITGIKPYNLSKILSGKKSYVFGDDWNKLCDHFVELDDRTNNVLSAKKDEKLSYVTEKWNCLLEDEKSEIVGMIKGFTSSRKGGCRMAGA